MKVLKYKDLNFVNHEIVLYVIADTHIGSEYFAEAELRKILNEILEFPNAYVILNGDLIDNATKRSVSFEYDDGLTPSASLGLALTLLKPLADANKILCINTGNHEERSLIEVGLDPTAILAQSLGIEDRYSSAMSLLLITHEVSPHKSTTFSVLAYHGSGGGVRIGSKANRVEDLSKVISCDVYAMSHVHAPMTFKEDYLEVDTKKGAINQRTRQYVVSNSFLNYGGYGEKKGYVPASISVPKIHLVAVRKEIDGVERTRKYTMCEV